MMKENQWSLSCAYKKNEVDLMEAW
jgi:hypothetical protein